MRIISLNTRKRLGNAKIARYVEYWLARQKCDLFVAQEPWVRSKTQHVDLHGYKGIGGNDSVYAWINVRHGMPHLSQIEDNWLEINLGYMALHVLYLSAYSGAQRKSQIEHLKRHLLKGQDRPLMVVGDFNFAPEPVDGIVGGKPSSWTSEEERIVFNNLKHEIQLIDATSSPTFGHQEYTIHRNIRGRDIFFRCDLALVSDFIYQSTLVLYDHSVRIGETAFTDHSALLIDIPIDLTPANLFSMDTPSDEDAPLLHPHKTAMARTEPSKVASVLHSSGLLKTLNIKGILDFGCGRGRDINFYRSLDLDVDGYDPHSEFGWSVLPTRSYDLVTVVFVLNVLSDPWQRIKALRTASEHVASGGYLFVATRSPLEIGREAKFKNWKTYNDGYMSHDKKGTFQKGISTEEMEIMIKRLGFHRVDYELNLGPETSFILAKRSSPS